MNLLTRLVAGLAACICASLLGLGTNAAIAQTVTNVASAQWSVGGRDFGTNSNVVSFDVRQPAGATLTTLTPMPNGPQRVDLAADYCSGISTVQSARAIGGGGGATSLIKTGQIRIGQRLVLRIDAAFANRNANAPDTLRLTLSTPGGDAEEVTALEDGPNSGAFYASIGTIPFPPPIVQGDCRLSLEAGETIAIRAFVEGRLEPILFGRVNALADPFGVVFDSLTGELVDGASVTLIDVNTGQPAEVFAFDGITPFPSIVVTGTQAIDANGDVYPFAPGEFRFPLVGFGRYRYEVEPPSPIPHLPK